MFKYLILFLQQIKFLQYLKSPQINCVQKKYPAREFTKNKIKKVHGMLVWAGAWACLNGIEHSHPPILGWDEKNVGAILTQSNRHSRTHTQGRDRQANKHIERDVGKIIWLQAK